VKKDQSFDIIAGHARNALHGLDVRAAAAVPGRSAFRSADSLREPRGA